MGVHTPVKRPAGGAVLHSDTRCYNRLLTALRAPTKRAHTLLGYWRALERVTVCPWGTSTIMSAALVLSSTTPGRWWANLKPLSKPPSSFFPHPPVSGILTGLTGD